MCGGQRPEVTGRALLPLREAPDLPLRPPPPPQVLDRYVLLRPWRAARLPACLAPAPEPRRPLEAEDVEDGALPVTAMAYLAAEPATTGASPAELRRARCCCLPVATSCMLSMLASLLRLRRLCCTGLMARLCREREASLHFGAADRRALPVPRAVVPPPLVLRARRADFRGLAS